MIALDPGVGVGDGGVLTGILRSEKGARREKPKFKGQASPEAGRKEEVGEF